MPGLLDTLFLAEIGLPPAKLDPPQIGALGIAILNSGAMHILDFWVRVIPNHPAQQPSILKFQWRSA